MKFRTDIHYIQRINPTDFDFSLKNYSEVEICVCHSNIFTTVGRIADILFKHSWSPEDTSHSLRSFLDFSRCTTYRLFLFHDEMSEQLFFFFQGINTVQMFLSVLVCLTFLFLLKHDNSWMDCHGFFRTKSHDPQRMIDYFEIFKAQDKKKSGVQFVLNFGL